MVQSFNIDFTLKSPKAYSLTVTKSVGGVSLDVVEEKIAEHNVDPSAHENRFSQYDLTLAGIEERTTTLENNQSELGDQVQGIQGDVNTLKTKKADKAITLEGYGITDGVSLDGEEEISNKTLSNSVIKGELNLQGGEEGTALNVSFNGTTAVLATNNGFEIASDTSFDKVPSVKADTSYSELLPNSLTPKKVVAQAISEHNQAEDSHVDLRESAGTAISLAKKANQAKAYTSYETLVSDLNLEVDAGFSVGQSLFIETVDVPDLWVSSVADEASSYIYISDEQFISDLNSGVQIGWYKLSFLETQKVDLTNYAKKATSLAGYGITDAYTKSETDSLLELKADKSDTYTKEEVDTLIPDTSSYLKNTATGNGALAVGNGAVASQPLSVAFGPSAKANGGLLAIGYLTTASGFNSMAMGWNAKATADFALAFGYGATASEYSSIQIGTGTNSTEGTTQIRDWTLLDANGNIPVKRLANAFPTVTDSSETSVTLTPIKNNIYNYTELTSIDISAPSSVDPSFISQVNFTSGATATVFTNTGSYSLVGDDVTDGTFTPVSNKRYSLILYYDGVYLRAVSSGV